MCAEWGDTGLSYRARRSFARSRPRRAAQAGETRRAHLRSGSCRNTGASEHMSTQSTGTTETFPRAPASLSESSRASYASRAPARVQQPPMQNWTDSASFWDDCRRHFSQSCANAGPPQTTDLSLAGSPHWGQTAAGRLAKRDRFRFIGKSVPGLSGRSVCIVAGVEDRGSDGHCSHGSRCYNAGTLPGKPWRMESECFDRGLRDYRTVHRHQGCGLRGSLPGGLHPLGR